VKTHYELLALQPSASCDDVKHAFRREIARYHPDKVQHLGAEFQELASVHAAELTKAYTVLMDPQLRTEYDASLQLPGAATGTASPPDAAAAAGSEAHHEPESRGSTAATAERESVEGSRKPEQLMPEDFLRKASIERMREALSEEFPDADSLPAKDFDIACALRSRRALFRKGEAPVTFLVKYVVRIDAIAVEDTWAVAAKFPAGTESSRCVLLMSPGLASARELAGAISEQRRRYRTPVTIVPLDVRDWAALIPSDTPQAVKGFLERLRSIS
jgi:curved DNA-binding protein CbpA